ncbi:MAG: hypothetical protein WBD40_06005 [Tepidisphaeraceae bacterium]
MIVPSTYTTSRGLPLSSLISTSAKNPYPIPCAMLNVSGIVSSVRKAGMAASKWSKAPAPPQWDLWFLGSILVGVITVTIPIVRWAQPTKASTAPPT